jgi:HTH-type transcriptional regulator/antitoxin HigA
MQRRFKVDMKSIKTKEDYRSALSRVEGLMDATPNSPEEDELDVLSSLVEIYESQHYPIPDAQPLEVIRFGMEQNNL